VAEVLSNAWGPSPVIGWALAQSSAPWAVAAERVSEAARRREKGRRMIDVEGEDGAARP